MIRIIYVPAVDELIPNGAIYYKLPISGKDVVDVIADDDFSTEGEVLYNSNGGPSLPEPFVHHFSGWEV
jgi:hypothetical protein